MTIGEKIKSLRTKKGMTQEALAEELNVSRSAIAKWENNNGIPEISNLKLISRIFNVSLDDIVDDETCIHPEKKRKSLSGYAGWYCSIDLVGWNDGVHEVLILSEDEDFLYYQKTEKKKTVYGMIGKKHVSTVEKKSQCDKLDVSVHVDREYFCNKNVLIEIACKEGLIKGFFDFTNDDYRNVVISTFENTKVVLNLGREIEINTVTKIEEVSV